MLRRAWRSMWFMDDDDRTTQGKLARGFFYLVYWVAFIAILSGIAHTLFDKGH